MANQNFLEKDLETILFETPADKLRERGLNTMFYDCIEHQIDLGSYGIADIVTLNYIQKNTECPERHLIITIYELKNKVINAGVLFQAARYYKGLNEFCNSNFDIDNTIIKYRICLIGSSIDKSDFIYLADLFDNFYIYTFTYEFDGIRFNREKGYALTSPKYPIDLKDFIKSRMSEMIFLTLGRYDRFIAQQKNINKEEIPF